MAWEATSKYRNHGNGWSQGSWGAWKDGWSQDHWSDNADESGWDCWQGTHDNGWSWEQHEGAEMHAHKKSSDETSSAELTAQLGDIQHYLQSLPRDTFTPAQATVAVLSCKEEAANKFLGTL